MPRRLFVVEDDEKSRRLLVDVLGFHGYEVVAFTNGEAALAAAGTEHPVAALLDIQLPGASGFQILTQLRDRIPALVAIAVTASVMDHDRRRIMDAGFDAYCPKPVNIKELLATLDRLIAKGAP